MNSQSFLDGMRHGNGMGMADTRGYAQRSADQDQTQSGNPGTVFNSPRFVNNKMPARSFDHSGFAQQPNVDSGARMMGGGLVDFDANRAQVAAQGQLQRFQAPRFAPRRGMPARLGQMQDELQPVQQPVRFMAPRGMSLNTGRRPTAIQ